jgi:hypothetical protein
MNDFDNKIITAYKEDKLSEKQIADLFTLSSKKVRNILNDNKVVRRTRSEASRYYHLTKFHKRESTPKVLLSKEEELLKVAGVMLYWGEGTKNRGTVALSNSDPKLLQVYMRFLRIICNVQEERIHVTLHYYPDHDSSKLIKFWSGILELPTLQFYKPFLHVKRSGGTYRNMSTFGTVSIQYSDSKLFAYIKQLMKEYGDLGILT